MKKYNWIIVCHTWHVGSKGFYSKFLLDATEKEARAEASLLADEHRDSLCFSIGKAFLLPDTVLVKI